MAVGGAGSSTPLTRAHGCCQVAVGAGDEPGVGACARARAGRYCGLALCWLRLKCLAADGDEVGVSSFVLCAACVL